MKRLVAILLPMLILISCSKNDSPNPITEQSNYLVKNSSSIGKWKLTGLTVGTVVQKLTSSQALYVKRYSTDLSYSDSDGLVGTWSMPTANTLVEVYTNFSSGVSVTQTYKINIISASQLNLTYSVNGTDITTNYTATN